VKYLDKWIKRTYNKTKCGTLKETCLSL